MRPGPSSSRSSRPSWSRAGFRPCPRASSSRCSSVADGRLSSAELVEQLQISPAAVSGAVRYLTGLRLVHKERVPGSRREYYRMPADIWHQVMMMQSQVLVRWTVLLKEGLDLVGRDTAAGERMADHAAYFEFLTTEMPVLFARWEASGRSDSSG